ncbi:small membrane A-kinase anchor protein isoform X1 [Falco naumanni]|uniref:small membrane A-kinase anchor protein isoform X1 n=1 Tax=Falco naumanni TaxID=148594 RepID=UPI001ADDEFD4|nr:small membrane A-kinase anchor protein isoform X1 [Falco naumanni]
MMMMMMMMMGLWRTARPGLGAGGTRARSWRHLWRKGQPSAPCPPAEAAARWPGARRWRRICNMRFPLQPPPPRRVPVVTLSVLYWGHVGQLDKSRFLQK